MKPNVLRLASLTLVGLALLVLTAWFLLYRDTSIYAPGFNQSAFEQVRPGMTESEVRKLLGEPLGIQGRAWYYSDPSDSGVYHAKIIVFSDGMRVSYKDTYVMHD